MSSAAAERRSRDRLAAFDGDRRREGCHLGREIALARIQIHPDAQDDVVDPVCFRRELGEDTSQLAARHVHVIGPLDGRIDLRIAQRLRQRHGGDERDLRRPLRRQLGPENDRQVQVQLWRRGPGPATPATPSGLLLGDDHLSVATAPATAAAPSACSDCVDGRASK